MGFQTWFLRAGLPVCVVAALLTGCVLETRPQPPRILFLGNSITMVRKDTASGWKQDMGMAATSPDKDYVHQTAAILKGDGLELEPVVGARDCVVCDGVINEHLENIAEVTDLDPRYVVVQLGENSNLVQVQSGQLTQQYLALLQALEDRGAQRIFCISIWHEGRLSDPHNDAILRAIRHFPDIHFVDITALASDSTNFGDPAIYSNPDVLWHPGDKGMRRIAEILSQAILENR